MIVKKSDDAVSPVIGVMLMIVIVVVIAAVVTAFATGMMSETEAAPVAVLDVEILSNAIALDGTSYGEGNLAGPDFRITHVSGDAVDTKDVELRFSWTHKDGSGNDCTHYSTYSADGCKEKFPNGIGENPPRAQALYVKTGMNLQRPNYYGSTTSVAVNDGWSYNHYFGDVILNPGLVLIASPDFLTLGGTHTESMFMDIIFNNYQKGQLQKSSQAATISHDPESCTGDPNGMRCKFLGGAWRSFCGYEKADMNGYCTACYVSMGEVNGAHAPSACTESCACYAEVEVPAIMSHLRPGTAVDVMIVHLPSNKAIYDNTVVVQ